MQGENGVTWIDKFLNLIFFCFILYTDKAVNGQENAFLIGDRNREIHFIFLHFFFPFNTKTGKAARNKDIHCFAQATSGRTASIMINVNSNTTTRFCVQSLELIICIENINYVTELKIPLKLYKNKCISVKIIENGKGHNYEKIIKCK